MQTMMDISNGITDLEMSRFVLTANGRSQVNLYQAKVMDIGGFKLYEPLILSGNLPKDEFVQGLLGMDFLGKFKFRIDHEKNLLYLNP